MQSACYHHDMANSLNWQLMLHNLYVGNHSVPIPDVHERLDIVLESSLGEKTLFLRVGDLMCLTVGMHTALSHISTNVNTPQTPKTAKQLPKQP